jgi:hypothetical protein
MVIIGVEEGYRARGLMAIRRGLCRSGVGCGELVECAKCCEFREVLEVLVWKSFVPRGTLCLEDMLIVPRGTLACEFAGRV